MPLFETESTAARAAPESQLQLLHAALPCLYQLCSGRWTDCKIAANLEPVVILPSVCSAKINYQQMKQRCSPGPPLMPSG